MKTDPRRKWSSLQVERIKLMREVGHTYEQITKVYPMSFSTLSYLLNEKTYQGEKHDNELK